MDPEIVLIKPDELYLKSGHVQNKMMKQLAHNILVSLKDKSIVYDSIVRGHLSIKIITPEPYDAINAIKNIMGISKLIPAVEVGPELKTIENIAMEMAKDRLNSKKTFAVRAKRIEKRLDISSKQIEEWLGDKIRKATKAKVNLSNPDVTIGIEFHKGTAYLFADVFKGFGGLPVGTSGKVLCLWESAKDSLAMFMMLKRGCEVIPLHFRSENQQAFLNACAAVEKYACGFKVKPNSIKGELDYKQVAEFAKEKNTKAIVTGHLDIPSFNIKDQIEMPCFMPLCGLDKKSIQKMLKELELS